MKKIERINLRVSDQLKTELKILADKDARPLSNYIAKILELHVQSEKNRNK